MALAAPLTAVILSRVSLVALVRVGSGIGGLGTRLGESVFIVSEAKEDYPTRGAA